MPDDCRIRAALGTLGNNGSNARSEIIFVERDDIDVVFWPRESDRNEGALLDAGCWFHVLRRWASPASRPGTRVMRVRLLGQLQRRSATATVQTPLLDSQDLAPVRSSKLRRTEQHV
jgi:hypothetical protein